MNLDEIQGIFFQECEEGLAAMEVSYGLCSAGTYDAETINTIFRAIHSIKGGAGAFGHERLQAFAHHYETVLDLLRTGELVLDPPLLGSLLSAFDMLADHVAAGRGLIETPDDSATLAMLLAVQNGSPAPAPAAAPVAASVEPRATAPDAFDDDIFGGALDDFLTPVEPTVGPIPWRVAFRPDRKAFDNGGEPLLLLRELERLGGHVLTVDLAELPPIATLDPTISYLAWNVAVPGSVDEDEIHAVFEFVSGLCQLDIRREGDVEDCVVVPIEDATPEPEPAPLPAPVAAVAVAPAPAPPARAAVSEPADRQAVTGGQSIRVDLDKLDRLVNLVGELVITQAMLAQRLSQDGLAGISEVTDLDHLTRELQDSAMSIRAQPMKSVFSRVPRIIRELEGETGKKVRLQLEGEMTEVDKTVVERIGEPLTHMIRNAVDHGLETPEERAAAGKPAEGLVRVAAEHRSGRIVISISDDGRGIDRQRVRAKAVERGIITADAQLSDEEVDNLIFAPGFSTAATISNISGRGVGMDVVRRNVQALGGRVGIASRFGHGSTFSLSLPLTLAVLDGMIVSVGDQTYVIPLNHIVESLRPKASDVTGLGPNSSLLDVRGSYVPIHRIGTLLGIEGAATAPDEAVLIVVETDNGKAVLMVDAILDQRQVVVKSLEANYSAIHGLAGATILGDGRVALILDVDTLTARSTFDDPADIQDLAA